MSLNFRIPRQTAAFLALALLAAPAHSALVDPSPTAGMPAEVRLSPTLENDSAPVTDMAAATPARFLARKEPVEQLFKALGAEMHKAFRVSVKARPYRISGEFDLARPFDVLDRVTASLGLIWYYDGQIIYVYDGSEASSVMLSTPPGAIDDLIAFLKNSSLYDKRFPLKQTAGTGLVYVSGPPRYVEIVQNAASMLRRQERTLQFETRSDRRVEVVKLRHAFVGDRAIERRDVTDSVPGLASVLSAVMGSGAVVSVSAAPATAQPALPGAMPPSTLALPPGVSEMPPLGMAAPDAPGGTAAPAAKPAAGTLEFPDVAPGNAPPMRVIAYPTNNSLLLEGTGAQIAMARNIIAQLDVPKDQVELSLWVIDIHKQDADALGAKWGAVGKVGPVDVRLNGSLLGQGSTLSRDQTLQFIASVTALSEQNKARIVSRPILLAQDNSPAVFDNSKSFYVKIHGERTATLHKVTYGTMINVVPHVVDGNGRIEMELAIEDGNSTAPSEDSHLDLPIVSSTRISTMARVQHAQSLLVGGYTLDESGENTSKIPLLGDIPFVGKMFTYKSNNGSQSVRLFLIQPRLLAEDSNFDSKSVSTPKEIDNAVDALRAQMEARHG
ncbi:type III secretion system outer membrane ring subunit SctC [Achromobacter xylosoxidans]|uniref:type III secretion system outer membrane ring subunit SctC n=1 Tax=Alcaligenes xylosoxydans xylosoxydans TaxID=85698 RepID=UPI0012AA0070|nr:type III secretion system outer membrane ring subunit SctC [Achromobacter xylosoxidans]MCZ8438941.1 type III secretion system outer membrane ring subunit SctC [Achromobacter xylosoxidans]CUR68112.1 Outer membrane protein MxiD precursor [Achromobacter xylosoxidans]